MYDRDTFEHNGRTFVFRAQHDDCADSPWDREDGHGPVSEWTSRAKMPGERVLASSRHSYRYYDFQEAVKIALRDGWDAEPYKTGTKGEQAARAVEADFERLKAWCNDEWSYIGVIVEHADSGERESLWGIESDATEWIEETASELAEEISARLDTAMAAEIEASRPDMAPSY